MAGILGEYTEVFLEESEDQIEELNSNLVKLEKDHENPEIINDIFRAAHSLKSSSAFVGLYNLSDLAHTMENLLQKIREGSLEINVKLVNLLFECFDLIKQVIEGVANGVKVETPFTDMIKKLQDYEASPTQSGSGTTKFSETKTSKESALSSITLNEEEISEIRQSLKEDNDLTAFSVQLKLKDETPMQNLRLLLILQSVKQSGVIIKCNPSEDALDNGQGSFALSFVTVTRLNRQELHVQCNIDMVDTLSVEEIKLPETEMEALEKKTDASNISSTNTMSTHSDSEEKQVTKGSANFEKAVTDSKVVMRTIKVSSDKLDQLMNNVGELVITNSGFQKIYDDLVAQFGEDSLFNELKGKIDQINRISKDLQTGIMNIRMVPIGSVFNRFTRLIRDLSLETGKQVNLVLRGENTELDKKVIDAIGEPLIHLIRNSVDHGIESPSERRAAGKPEEGTVELNAYQGGSNILVEIRDDGKGLNKDKILKKAIERGLVNDTDAQNLSESDIFQFIFAPGFSTADKISDISGRGVGMNVVNKLIEEFKGKILIHSEEGKGSSFTLSFPQALAIIPSILVIMEEEVYAFPLSEVSETIKVNLDQITTLEGHEIINLRGEVLPIYRLNRILGLADKQDMVEVPVVIVNYKTRKLGFMVDDLIGKHETVIKSLGKNFKDIQGLTGATIMGDGTIILVLDIPGLVEIAADKVDWSDKLVAGEMMKRASTIRSLEMSDSEFMFKSNHPTNRYNAKLIELRAKDKSRVKKDKHKIEKHVIVPKEEVFAEEPVTNLKITTEVIKTETEVNGDSGESSKSATATLVIDHKTDEIHRLADVAKIENVKLTEREQAAEIIKGFVEQKEERLNQVAALNSEAINEIMSSKDIKKLENIVNTGMMNAGVVLSQLVGKEVELFIPEIKLTDREGLAKEFRYSMDQFFGMKIRMTGDLNGNLLMMFSEENGSEIAKELLGSEDAKYAEGSLHKLSEDMVSVLSEISNIVCSSVMNSLSNKLKKEILPSVPEMITGSFMDVIDIVKPERTKFLSMHTEFNHQGSNLIGVLVFLPDFDELVDLIHKS
ncbi:chemotaxis protein CheA [Leptospira bourretii]|uniref:Chemotaxis protein CheA n=1 Tax=Leptospira bourretii TaxID=2484962 RepID=A0A4R9IIU0_9LEPT|nr:chemotaxis protein CheW [Leptospira bourretii]TGK88404.1 chemotaxis protein CheA [Leptospira bourretii]TGK89052.1 chemotaxis protein CheA [Leptospira bourretii]TGL29638.1 chemotaxis protein CheA [Leptospira bourretii]